MQLLTTRPVHKRLPNSNDKLTNSAEFHRHGNPAAKDKFCGVA